MTIRTSNQCEQIVIENLNSRGYEVFKRGWPDLVAVNKKTGVVRFIEVKPVTKDLKTEQRNFKRIFEKMGLKYEVWYVEQINEITKIHKNDKPDIYKGFGRPKKAEYTKRHKELMSEE